MSNIEYPIFSEYHYWLKKWFQCILTLPRLDALSMKIPVVYATSRRAFALGGSELEVGNEGKPPLYAPPNQGNNWLPILAFHMTGMTPVLGKFIPYEHILYRATTKPPYSPNGQITGYTKRKPYLTFETTYIASLYCALVQDMDILTWKIVTEFKPQANLWIGPPETVGNRNEGVYAQMLLDSVTDATEYEPGDIGERVVRKDFAWKITEAYVPTSITVLDENIIKDVFIDTYYSVPPTTTTTQNGIEIDVNG